MDGWKNKGLGQGNKNPKAYWDCVNNIKVGFNGHSKKVSEQRFRNKNDDLCSNPENAKTVNYHFQRKFTTSKVTWIQQSLTKSSRNPLNLILMHFRVWKNSEKL